MEPSHEDLPTMEWARSLALVLENKITTDAETHAPSWIPMTPLSCNGLCSKLTS